ncbi:MAG: hypothetical protein A3C53_06970 [Omnitrophica WOR_2 bacterium RIFCSPHIGHO2_02_FULL_68_15]|nr:MAG: hypothetical protein A3C53_06970 [Omnitrophica WOR_2 bacterium RIFCSPHIGHO2_02_FULL_68_15]
MKKKFRPRPRGLLAAGVAAVVVLGFLIARPPDLARRSDQLAVEIGRALAQAGVRTGRLVQETATLARAWGGTYRVVEKTYTTPPKFSSDAFVRDLARRLPAQGFELQRVERRQTPQGIVTALDAGVRRYHLYRLTLQEPGLGGGTAPGMQAQSRWPSPLPAPTPSGRPKVAIVLDDWGYSRRLVPDVLKLNRPVTLAVLPHQPYSTAIAQQVAGSRCEVILHMPMEPRDDDYPREPQILLSGMPAAEARQMLSAAFATVPSAKGLSNHQGSKATEDAALMQTIMQELRRRRLFFLDSLTASHSACEPAATAAGVPFAARAVFLDNEETPEAIRRQLQELAAAARRAGWAVGIGHDKRVTLEVLEQAMPQMERDGIEFVPLSEVVG